MMMSSGWFCSTCNKNVDENIEKHRKLHSLTRAESSEGSKAFKGKKLCNKQGPYKHPVPVINKIKKKCVPAGPAAATAATSGGAPVGAAAVAPAATAGDAAAATGGGGGDDAAAPTATATASRV